MRDVENNIINNILSSKLPFQKLKNRKILVVGCNGFICSSLIYYLDKIMEKKGYKIYFYGIAKKGKNNNYYLKKLIKKNNIKIFNTDINKKINLNIKPDYLLHGASVTSPKEYSSRCDEVLTTNAVGTINLLNFSVKKNTKKFIFLSSGEVYGDMKFYKKQSFNETNFGELNPSILTSNYGISKKFAENALICWSKKFKLFTNSIRLFHTYGQGMKLKDGRVHSDLVNNMISKENLLIKSGGKTKRSFCYISDALSGIITVILKSKKYEIYNLSNPFEMHSVKKVAEILQKSEKNNKLKIKITKSDKRERNFFYRKPSINKLKKLGWTPKISCKVGFKETIKHFRNLD